MFQLVLQHIEYHSGPGGSIAAAGRQRRKRAAISASATTCRRDARASATACIPALSPSDEEVLNAPGTLQWESAKGLCVVSYITSSNNSRKLKRRHRDASFRCSTILNAWKLDDFPTRRIR